MNIFLFRKTRNALAGVFIITSLAATGSLIPMHRTYALGGKCGTPPVQPCASETTQKLGVAAQTITAGATSKLALKETLDGIAWAVAKQMVANMTQSMVEWINSGFQGSPAFITDLNGFIKDALDTIAGEYIKSLGEIGEFICSPFKLDVQSALQQNYQDAQSGVPSGANSCKLSGIEDNIKNFLGGTTQDWGQWVQVSSNPQNTPYGAYLQGESLLNVKLKNEAGKEYTLLDWANGMKSIKVCEGPNGTTSQPPCKNGTHEKITTPGDVISQQFNYQMHTGTDALITADEINEIIGALLNQITLQAMQGINGLLGLGGNSAYTDYSYGNGSNTTSYIQSAVTQETLLNVGVMQKQIGSSTETEAKFLALANNTLAIANIKIGVITDGQTALDNLLHSSTAQSLGITQTSTYNDAQAKVNTATAAGTFPLATLAEVQTQLTTLHNSLTVIAAASPSLTQGTDLATTTFATLQTESAAAKISLTNLVTEVTALLPQIQATLTALQRINAVFTNASSSTNTSVTNSAVQKAMTDYISLVQSGVVITETGLVAKRNEWQDALGNGTTISGT